MAGGKGFHGELFRRHSILRWLAYIAGYLRASQMRSLLLEAAAAAAKHTGEDNVYRVLWSIGFIPRLEDVRRIKIDIYRKPEIEAFRDLGFFTEEYVDIDDMDITIPRIYYAHLRGVPERIRIGTDEAKTGRFKAPEWLLFIPPNYERLYSRPVINDGLLPRKLYPGFVQYDRFDQLILDDLSRIFISDEEIVKKYDGIYSRLYDDIELPAGLPIRDGGRVDMRTLPSKILRLLIAATAKASKELSGEATNLAVELSMYRWNLSNFIPRVIHDEQNPEVKKRLLRVYANTIARYMACLGLGARVEALLYTGRVLEWDRNPDMYRYELQQLAGGSSGVLNGTTLLGVDVFKRKYIKTNLAEPYTSIMWRAITDEELAEFDWLDNIVFTEDELKRWAYTDEYIKTAMPIVEDRVRALMLTKEGADVIKIDNFFTTFDEIRRWYSRVYDIDFELFYKLSDKLTKEEMNIEYGQPSWLLRNMRYINVKHRFMLLDGFSKFMRETVGIFKGVDENEKRKLTYLRTPDHQFFRDCFRCAEKIYMEAAGDCIINTTSNIFDTFPGNFVQCGAYSVHCMSDQRFEGAVSSDPSVLVMPVEESAVGGILESWPIGLYNDGGILHVDPDYRVSATLYIEFPTLIVRREIAEDEIDRDRSPVRRRYRAVYLNVYEFDAEIPYARIHTYPLPKIVSGVFSEDMDPYPAQAMSPGFNEVKIYSEHLYGLRPVYSIVHSLRVGILDPVSAADIFHAVGIVAVATKPECMEALLSGRTSREVLKICCENCYQPGKEFLPHGARPIFISIPSEHSGFRWLYGADLMTGYLSRPRFTTDDYIALYARIAYAASKHLEEITWRSASIALSRSKKDRDSFASPAGASLFARHLMDVVLSAYMPTRWGPHSSATPRDAVVAVNEENLLRIIRSLPRNTPLGMLPWEVKRGPMAPDVPRLEEIEGIFGERIWPVIRPGGYSIPRPELMEGLAPRPLYKGLAIVKTLGDGHEVSRFILRSIGERIEILRRRMEAAEREAASPSEATVYEELKRIPPEKLGAPIPSRDALGRARISASKRYRVIADEYRRAIKTIGKALRWFRVAEDLQRRIEEIIGDLG